MLAVAVTIFVSFENDACQKARLLASSQEESGYWLGALPSTSLGLCLDNDSLRIAVALRLGAKICNTHNCKCGKKVDEFGHHGTVREDGKRPDGLTLTPWSHGKCLLWDATCGDTLAKSYVKQTSRDVGWVARTAEQDKISHYSSLLSQYHFIPLGFETLGPWGPHCKKFVSDLGKRISELTHEKRATLYLKQRLSIDVQRGNAISVLNTLPSTSSLEEVFYLISKKKTNFL
ncbi:uncharacterized protein LOC119068371 [Bradysia coprophila]|uniref:uncharacterized protein LOC119068371 n=1 Tax=Bradysia coprophila TaxID=38358 RepID=UPI00187D94D1|nr:uncharacterized protein LOC119068371 [Bradysia coprophila]